MKSEFNWKIKSHKILRLEFISDKIEGEDSKRKVMCIRFGHPIKKNELVWGSPWEGSHGQSWSSMGTQPYCSLSVRFVSVAACCAVREVEEEKEEREKKKKRKEKKRNMEIFPNLKIFGEKNKRQFMKLV
jgi:hypothetical protein